MILVVLFFFSNMIIIILVDYAVTDMSCFDDYLDAAPRAKKMRVNYITTFLLHIYQCITFHNLFCYRNTYYQGIVEVILFKVMFKGY